MVIGFLFATSPSLSSSLLRQRPLVDLGAPLSLACQEARYLIPGEAGHFQTSGVLPHYNAHLSLGHTAAPACLDAPVPQRRQHRLTVALSHGYQQRPRGEEPQRLQRGGGADSLRLRE